ncbi:hypothetical protein CSUI_003856, partial [Cystoisospora suis]
MSHMKERIPSSLSDSSAFSYIIHRVYIHLMLGVSRLVDLVLRSHLSGNFHFSSFLYFIHHSSLLHNPHSPSQGRHSYLPSCRTSSPSSSEYRDTSRQQKDEIRLPKPFREVLSFPSPNRILSLDAGRTLSSFVSLLFTTEACCLRSKLCRSRSSLFSSSEEIGELDHSSHAMETHPLRDQENDAVAKMIDFYKREKGEEEERRRREDEGEEENMKERREEEEEIMFLWLVDFLCGGSNGDLFKEMTSHDQEKHSSFSSSSLLSSSSSLSPLLAFQLHLYRIVGLYMSSSLFSCISHRLYLLFPELSTHLVNKASLPRERSEEAGEERIPSSKSREWDRDRVDPPFSSSCFSSDSSIPDSLPFRSSLHTCLYQHALDSIDEGERCLQLLSSFLSMKGKRRKPDMIMGRSSLPPWLFSSSSSSDRDLETSQEVKRRKKKRTEKEKEERTAHEGLCEASIVKSVGEVLLQSRYFKKFLLLFLKEGEERNLLLSSSFHVEETRKKTFSQVEEEKKKKEEEENDLHAREPLDQGQSHDLSSVDRRERKERREDLQSSLHSDRGRDLIRLFFSFYCWLHVSLPSKEIRKEEEKEKEKEREEGLRRMRDFLSPVILDVLLGWICKELTPTASTSPTTTTAEEEEERDTYRAVSLTAVSRVSSFLLKRILSDMTRSRSLLEPLVFLGNPRDLHRDTGETRLKHLCETAPATYSTLLSSSSSSSFSSPSSHLVPLSSSSSSSSSSSASSRHHREVSEEALMRSFLTFLHEEKEDFWRQVFHQVILQGLSVYTWNSMKRSISIFQRDLRRHLFHVKLRHDGTIEDAVALLPLLESREEREKGILYVLQIVLLCLLSRKERTRKEEEETNRDFAGNRHEIVTVKGSNSHRGTIEKSSRPFHRLSTSIGKGGGEEEKRRAEGEKVLRSLKEIQHRFFLSPNFTLGHLRKACRESGGLKDLEKFVERILARVALCSPPHSALLRGISSIAYQLLKQDFLATSRLEDAARLCFLHAASIQAQFYEASSTTSPPPRSSEDPQEEEEEEVFPRSSSSSLVSFSSSDLRTCVDNRKGGERRRGKRRRYLALSFSSSSSFFSCNYDFPLWLLQGLHRLQKTIEGGEGENEEEEEKRATKRRKDTTSQPFSVSPCDETTNTHGDEERFFHAAEKIERREEKEEESNFEEKHRRLCLITRALLKACLRLLSGEEANEKDTREEGSSLFYNPLLLQHHAPPPHHLSSSLSSSSSSSGGLRSFEASLHAKEYLECLIDDLSLVRHLMSCLSYRSTSYASDITSSSFAPWSSSFFASSSSSSPLSSSLPSFRTPFLLFIPPVLLDLYLPLKQNEEEEEGEDVSSKTSPFSGGEKEGDPSSKHGANLIVGETCVVIPRVSDEDEEDLEDEEERTFFPALQKDQDEEEEEEEEEDRYHPSSSSRGLVWRGERSKEKEKKDQGEDEEDEERDNLEEYECPTWKRLCLYEYDMKSQRDRRSKRRDNEKKKKKRDGLLSSEDATVLVDEEGGGDRSTRAISQHHTFPEEFVKRLVDIAAAKCLLLEAGVFSSPEEKKFLWRSDPVDLIQRLTSVGYLCTSIRLAESTNIDLYLPFLSFIMNFILIKERDYLLPRRSLFSPPYASSQTPLEAS